MKKPILLLFLFLAIPLIHSQENASKTPFEASEGNRTATYEQAILFYQNLAEKYPEIAIKEFETTDSGLPIHLVTFDNSKTFDYNNDEKITVLINNGIHPGESDGIDASMLLLRDIAQDSILKKKYDNVLICVIPIYNVGGSLNRNSTSRVNQNGPISYGFRGNAKNYDLNRDFIKNDTKNARAFAKLFHTINPAVFIDTHVSNGADYQYTLTHLFTQQNKLGGKIGDYINFKMLPEIEESLASKNIITGPFVNVFNSVPENGFSQFLDSPQYSTGYTALFNTLGLMAETHMLKPYKQRVEAVYQLMLSTLDFSAKNNATVNYIKKNEHLEIIAKKTYPIQWEIDSTYYKTINFKGYEASYIKSKITGQKRLKYNQNRPFSKPTTYYNQYKASKEIVIPNYYIIPKTCVNVIERLKLNNIEAHPIRKAISIEVESYKIESYNTSERPYEGHYIHSDTKVSTTIRHQNFNEGDFLVATNQPGIRYILETLEPEATDSFFNWNFFDIILQQKEHFSPYVFEDVAVEILANNKILKATFEKKKANDSIFSNDGNAQLEYIYKNSKYAEKSYLQYPIYRILQ